MKAEYFSDLSISKKVTETVETKLGEYEDIERHVDYKKVTFYIPKAELVKQGINFDEYARYSMFDITPANFSGEQVTISKSEYDALTSGKEWMLPETIRQSFITAINVMKDILEDTKER